MFAALRIASSASSPMKQMSCRFFSASAVANQQIKNVVIVGSGLMGSGIAQVSAQAKFNVTLVDVAQQPLDKATGSIQKSLSRVAKKTFEGKAEEADAFVKETMGRISTSVSAEDAVKNADLVIEAIIENMDKKHTLFSKIDKAAPSHTIFASNTSSLRIGEIAVSTNRKDRFGGLHFFNPVPVMKLVEIITTKELTQPTVDALFQYTRDIKKVPVKCRDTPGFIVNRLLVPYMMESIRLYERGDASLQDIDTAMKLGAGYPMGPITLADYVGLDTCKYIIDGWSKQYPNSEIFAPSPLLNRLVAEGKHGIKTGEGFYKYNAQGERAN